MDWNTMKTKIPGFIGRYKYVLLIILVGVVLMSIPSPNPAQHEIKTESMPAEEPLSDRLEEILGKIEGVGKVQVLLTQAVGEETIYQQDEDRTASGDVRLETVIIADDSRNQQGLIRTVTSPVYLGAIVVCQGGDSSAVRLSVVQAVAGVTGIGTDRIIVLKMK